VSFSFLHFSFLCSTSLQTEIFCNNVSVPISFAENCPNYTARWMFMSSDPCAPNRGDETLFLKCYFWWERPSIGVCQHVNSKSVRVQSFFLRRPLSTRSLGGVRSLDLTWSVCPKQLNVSCEQFGLNTTLRLASNILLHRTFASPLSSKNKIKRK